MQCQHTRQEVMQMQEAACCWMTSTAPSIALPPFASDSNGSGDDKLAEAAPAAEEPLQDLRSSTCRL